MDEKEERQALLERMKGKFDSSREARAVQGEALKWLQNHPDDEEVSWLADDLVILMLQIDQEEMIRRRGLKAPRIVRLDKPD